MPFRGRIVTAAKNKSSPCDEQQSAQHYHQSQKSSAFHKRGYFVSCRDAGKYVNQTLLPFHGFNVDIALIWHFRTDSDPGAPHFREAIIAALGSNLGKPKRIQGAKAPGA
jgi:hypothetical protein